MIFREQAPSPDLAAVIDRFWYFEPEASDPESYEHVIVPEGTAGLCLIEPFPQIGAFISLTGPAERAVRVPVQRGLRYWGLRLRTGAENLRNEPEARVRNRMAGRRGGDAVRFEGTHVRVALTVHARFSEGASTF